MKRSYLSYLLTLVLAACGESKTLGNNAPTPTAADPAKPSVAASAKGQCLLSYQHKFDELLTLSLAAETAKLAEDKATKEYRNNTAKALKTDKRSGFDIGTNELRYDWPSERTREIPIGTSKTKVPVNNSVGLRGMSVMTKQFFENSYRPMTEQEIEALKKKAEEEVSADKKPAAGILSETLGAVTQGYREVTGVGEAARWNTVDKSLYVFVDGIKFELRVELSDDNDADRDVAVALVPKVLAKCP